MAESSDGQEKSEEPTGKKLSEARDKGQVPRSRELATVAMLIASAGALLVLGDDVMRGLMALVARGFTLSREEVFDTNAMTSRLMDEMVEALVLLTPLVLVLIVAAILANIAMSGWIFSMQALEPKLEKLDPIKGMKRVFSWRGLVEMLKGLAKFALVAVVGVLWLQMLAGEFLGLGFESLPAGMAHAGELLVWSYLVLSSALIVVAVVDIPFQFWDHKRQLKMTKQEVKEEHKQTEGSPEVKGRQRRLQMEMATRRMMQEVPKADVVVTNPTHYAVALQYDQGEMDAPKLIAKGADEVAARIRAIAVEHNIPILSAPPLARALYHSTELNEYIPAGLYRAVAQVLAYVYHLRQGPTYDRSGGDPLKDLPIPEELRRDE